MMPGTLLLAVLSVKGSYADEIEIPLDGPDDIPNTLQWWISDVSAWRIVTFAIDRDIHTYRIGGEPEKMLALALENNRKHYGDIIAAVHTLEFADCHDAAEVAATFAAVGLEPRLEVAGDDFAFWKPEDVPYETKSTPK